jgi:hypothetical protein
VFSRDIAGGLLRGARREKPNDRGQTNHYDDDRADEAGSWQKGGEGDGQGERADAPGHAIPAPRRHRCTDQPRMVLEGQSIAVQSGHLGSSTPSP